jgi:hypothetical protein
MPAAANPPPVLAGMNYRSLKSFGFSHRQCWWRISSPDPQVRRLPHYAQAPESVKQP